MRDFLAEQNRLLEKIAKNLGVDDKNPENLFLGLLHTVKREGIDDLIEYIKQTDFFTAPASTKFHGNRECGLVAHSLNVYALLAVKNNQLHLGLSDETVILTGLLHDLCKANFYIVEYKNKKVYSENGKKYDTLGNFDWVSYPGFSVDDKFPLGHGEKSLSIVQDFIKLSDTEKLMIRWHMGPFASSEPYGFNTAIDYEPAVCAIYTADMEASTLFETKE